MSTILILLFLLLIVGVLYQLAKVNELASVLKEGAQQDDKATQIDSANQANYLVVFIASFFVFAIWVAAKYVDKLLPVAASEHGGKIDQLFNITLIVITLVFIVTHIALAYFAWKYKYDPNRKATFQAHDSKLEMIWTVVPTIVLTGMIIYGLGLWNEILYPEKDNAVKLELYAQQFAWTARYAGTDGTLGDFNYRLTDDTKNPLALDISKNTKANDDLIINDEFHLPKGKEVFFNFRSRDIIHSAYMPHFRAQMNCVPGQTTQFGFKPIYTTEEMRKITNNPKFEYQLLCNKICGGSHYNMGMIIVIDEPADYAKWVAEQTKTKTFQTLSGATKTPEAKKEMANL